MSHSPLIGRLIEAFRVLPGVGPKSAQRMAFHLLERQREAALQLSDVLREAVEHVGNCQRCRTLTEAELCPVCANSSRSDAQLCVVESPSDVTAMEKTAAFSGRYFVLMGRLSPLDGIGPAELGMDLLDQRLAEGAVEELIIATNPTVEGEATAHYLSEMARRRGVRPTRLAHGIPLGGELEFVDGETLSHALAGRREI
ncbi:MAG: recombination mediator RecR [Gammaproteobacteria bacterium]